MECGCVMVMVQSLSVQWANDYSKVNGTRTCIHNSQSVIPSHTVIHRSLQKKIKEFSSWLLYVCNGLVQILWFLNLLIRQVLKCITLLPANPVLPMVEVAVLLVVKKH